MYVGVSILHLDGAASQFVERAKVLGAVSLAHDVEAYRAGMIGHPQTYKNSGSSSSAKSVENAIAEWLALDC